MFTFKVGIVVAFALIAISAPVSAQTCSCARVPMLGTMQTATPSNKQWFVASTYEFHDISELVSGTSTIPDQTWPGQDITGAGVRDQPWPDL